MLTVLGIVIFASTKVIIYIYLLTLVKIQNFVSQKIGSDYNLSDNTYAYIVISILCIAAVGSIIYSLMFFSKLLRSDSLYLVHTY